MIYFNSVPFKNPELSDTYLIDTKQSVRRAYSGNIYSMRLREQQVFHLAFKNMPYSQAVLMKEYLKSDDPVTYKDYNGVIWSVRMQDQTIELTLDNAGHGKTLVDDECVVGINDWVSFEINLEVVSS